MHSGANHDLVAQLKQDWRAAQLSDADRAMLSYAEKLTLNPSTMSRADLESLRAHFAEEQIFDIVVIICLFNFMDRIADAFGVELDAMMAQIAQAAPEGEALPELSAARRT